MQSNTMQYLATLCLFAIPSYVIAALHLPPEFPKCKRADPKFNECLKSAVEGAFKIMAKGLPEFKIESINPIRIPSLTIGKGSTGPVRVLQQYENFQIFNIPSTTVTNADFVITDKEFKLNIASQFSNDHQLYIKSQYKLTGQILLLPIVGNGNCTLKLLNTKVMLDLMGKLVEKKQQKYAQVESVKVLLQPEKVEYDFENLFNGDPRLGPEMNRILNDNWSEIFADVKEGYEEALGIVFKNNANLILQKIPFDELLPP